MQVISQPGTNMHAPPDRCSRAYLSMSVLSQLPVFHNPTAKILPGLIDEPQSKFVDHQDHALNWPHVMEQM
jgi:hypothetical protein